MRIVMLGPPGAGKGTQSIRLARVLAVPHLSTGDILRTAIQDRSPLGLQAKATVEAGSLVNDETIVGCVAERLMKPDAKAGFILDGFPRTVDQASALDHLLQGSGAVVDLAFELQVDVQHLAQRIAKRNDNAIASGGQVRADDNEDVLRRRIDAYQRHAAPLSDFYHRQGKLVVIDGLADLDTVFSRLAIEIDNRISDGLPAA
jgi:adenylate kinase